MEKKNLTNQRMLKERLKGQINATCTQWVGCDTDVRQKACQFIDAIPDSLMLPIWDFYPEEESGDIIFTQERDGVNVTVGVCKQGLGYYYVDRVCSSYYQQVQGKGVVLSPFPEELQYMMENWRR